MSHRHHTLSPREAAAPTEPLTSHVGRSRWRALLLGAALMLLLMAILGVAVQSNFRRLKEANRWNVHTYQVLERIDRVGTLLDTHEADLRGFALTGNAQYLRRLKQTNGVGARALDELRQLTSDRPSQQQRLSILKPQFLAYRKRFISPWMTIALSAQNSAQAQRTVREQTALRGRESRSLQRKLRLMESTERALIQQRALELERAQRETGRALAWGCLFAALLAVGLLYLLARSVRAQQRANAQTARLNQSLIAEIAERRTVEESLRASETGFRHLAEDSLDMICRHAPDGTLTYVSPAARPLLGYAPTEMIGVHPRRFLYDKEPPDESKSAEKRFAAQLRETQRKPLLRCYRHANGGKVWLEVVGHAIVDSESGEVRAWHTSARDVSARVRQERERERLTSGLRAVVEIADALIVAPNEEELLRRAVEMMRARVGLKRCSIYLSLPGENEGEFAPLMRGRFGTDADGRAVDESELFYDTENDPHCDDIKPAPGERWIVRRDQIRYQWQGGQRVELPGRGWLARTPIATRADVIGLFFHDGAPGDEPHDAVDQQLVAVFCSLLGALIERGRSQARMNRQQRLLESVMQSAPLFLYSVDAHEKFTLATGNILPAIGFDPPAMIGRVMPEVMSQSSSSVVGMRRALKGETMQEEIEFAGRWLKMWRQPLLDETEQICGMIGIGMDVTQQRRAQLALQESEARYRQVADALQDVLFQTDGAAHWTFLNSAWSEITGYTVESSLSAPCARALHPDDRDAFAQLVETARTSSTENSVAESSSAESSSVGSSSVGNSSAESSVAESSSGESSAGESSSGESSSGESSVADVPSQVLRFMTQSGEVRWLEVALRANFGGAGEFRGTAGLLRDVTEQLRAENALRETLQMKRAILQGASYAIISTDADGVIQTFNPAAERMIGVSADEVVGKKQPTFFHDAAEIEARAALIEEQTGAAPAAGFEALVARGQIEGGHSEAEWSCIRADGTRFPMRISHSVLRGPGGEVTGHVAIGYDLTETRRAEMLKNEFISVVSHELRTPLTSIRGALGLLSGGVAGELPDRATQMIGIAQKNADRLVLLINDILDIEKIESGKMRFEMSVIALGELLETALESNRGYAQTLGVELELEPLPPALREATVAGDEPRLQQVLSNLIVQRVQVDARRQRRAPARAVSARFDGGKSAHRGRSAGRRAGRAARIRVAIVRAFRPGRRQRHARKRRDGSGAGGDARHRRKARRQHRLPRPRCGGGPRGRDLPLRDARRQRARRQRARRQRARRQRARRQRARRQRAQRSARASNFRGAPTLAGDRG